MPPPAPTAHPLQPSRPSRVELRTPRRFPACRYGRCSFHPSVAERNPAADGRGGVHVNAESQTRRLGVAAIATGGAPLPARAAGARVVVLRGEDVLERAHAVATRIDERVREVIGSGAPDPADRSSASGPSSGAAAGLATKLLSRLLRECR